MFDLFGWKGKRVYQEAFQLSVETLPMHLEPFLVPKKGRQGEEESSGPRARHSFLAVESLMERRPFISLSGFPESTTTDLGHCCH